MMSEAVRAGSDDNRGMYRVRTGLSAVLTTILSVLLIWAVYNGGLRRGMDHAISFAGESELNGMAIAISELKHGLNAYVGYSTIRDALTTVVRRDVANTGDPQLLKNLKDSGVLNEAISSAVALGPQKESFIVDGTLMTMIYDDIGIVDYDKVAFSLFGYRIEAMYYLYFVILSVSVAAFLLQYWRDVVPQMALLATLLAFYVELDTLVFSEHVASVWGMRHGSVLAIVPMWHVAFLLMARVRISPAALVLALIQIAILVFSMRVRGSATWTLIFVSALVLGFVVQAWRARSAGQRTIATTLNAAIRWPFILLLIVVGANKIYTDARLHPAYFTDDILPYHGAWHSAYLGIFLSPTLAAESGVPPERWGDRSGYDAALKYLRGRGFIKLEGEYISPWTNTYKMRLHDNVMRSVYLSMVKEGPFTFLALYSYWKPQALYDTLRLVLSSVPWEKLLLMLLGSTALALLTALFQWATPAKALNAALLAAGAFLCASVPAFWAYASSHTIADIVVSLLVFIALAVWALAATMFQWLLQRVGTGGILPIRNRDA
jgi:hypothetical protein